MAQSEREGIFAIIKLPTFNLQTEEGIKGLIIVNAIRRMQLSGSKPYKVQWFSHSGKNTNGKETS